MPSQAELAELSPQEIELLYALDEPSDIEIDRGFDSNLRSLASFVLATAAYDAERDCKASAWIMSNGDGPGSFVWWCSVLNLDSATVRPLLLRLTHQQIIGITNGGT